jgi:nicotinate-nucleotide pyrophosphorylase (carboxylating)
MTDRREIAQDADVQSVVRRAIVEDVGSGDATSIALVPPEAVASASIISRSPCVVCGTTVAASVFAAVDPATKCEALVRDGGRADAGDRIMSVSGPARGILTAERTALNFMQRLCGIATLTSRFVEAVAGTGTVILDTRKTSPCLRILEKYAVRCGGGFNHRFGLYDRILIKDNHRQMWSRDGAGLADAVLESRRLFPGLEVEVEVESDDELKSVLTARPDWVLLDNMPIGLMRGCVGRCRGICRTEASGGITLANVSQVAGTGVDAISLGCLTHSAPATDLTLEIETL